MANFTFSNNISTNLAADVTATAVTITLSSTVGLPSSIPTGTVLAITLNDASTRQVFEVVYATAISGATLTVQRGQEGTSAVAWSTGDYVFSGVTAGQMSSLISAADVYQLLSPAASVGILPTALFTEVLPENNSGPITITLNKATKVGAVVRIYGNGNSSSTVTVIPADPSYSFASAGAGFVSTYTLPALWGVYLDLAWDGGNYRYQSAGSPEIVSASKAYQALPLGQAKTLFAALAGLSTQTFNVADAAAANHAVPLGQAQALFAALNGSSSEQFNVAPATSGNNAVALNQFVKGFNGNGAYWVIPGVGQLCRSAVLAPANGTVTWTFPLAFGAQPQVFYTTLTPSGGVTEAMWLNGISPSNASFFNPNSIGTNINVLAVF